MTTDYLDVKALGLNSGSSLNAVDCALCHFYQVHPTAPVRFELLKSGPVPLNGDVKKQVTAILSKGLTSPSELSELNVALGATFATAVHEFSRLHNLQASDIDVIGSHGQTIWLASTPSFYERKSALCFAEGSFIASNTGITTVTDFRISDQAAGRLGAPLTGFFDALLLHHPTKLRACQKIGRTATVCFVPPDCEGGVDKCYEFDSGPGTVFIDAAVRHFSGGQREHDNDGEMGRAGLVDDAFLSELLEHEYFDLPPPKTTGTEIFHERLATQMINRGERKGLKPEDIVASITRLSAQSIVDHYKQYAPRQDIDEIFLCGNGARNRNIWQYIQYHYPNTRLMELGDAGLPGEAREAVTAAWQAVEALAGRSIPVPLKAPTRREYVLGKISPGRNYRKVMKKGMLFGNDANWLPPVKEMINYVGGHPFNNKW